MKKTVIVGDCQVILEGIPEEIVAFERLQEQKQTIYNICVHVNGEDVNKKELEERIRKAIVETDKRLWDKERLKQ